MIKLLRKMLGKIAVTAPEDIPRARLRYEPGQFPVIYAIGDVHGCHAQLLDVHRRIVEDSAGIDGPKLMILLGDYIDRGPGSKGVLDYLCSDAPPGFERIALCGNHDDVFLKFLSDPIANMGWLEFGGHETLYSYGVDANHILRHGGGVEALAAAARAVVPARHIALLESMPIMVEIGKLLFVHAGIRPSVALDDQLDQDLLWIREPFLSEGPGLPLLVVHGHTADKEPVFGEGRIGIDTGAFATGRLTVLKVAEGKVRVL